jgi:hypothetical protein
VLALDFDFVTFRLCKQRDNADMKTESRTFKFSELRSADLIIDAVYEGGTYKNVKDDPLVPLVGVGNQGGFRYLGSPQQRSVRLCVLYTDLSDPDWPDMLDVERGTFLYYGDNKQPGGDLHDTPRGGNLILKQIFDDLHSGERHRIPPILVFTRGAKGRDVTFRGLAVPGAPAVGQTDDLVAIWKSKDGLRFQNYRALFSMLDVRMLPRLWVDAIRSGGDPLVAAPDEWKAWIEDRKYSLLRAEPSLKYRTPDEQLPADPARLKILETIVSHYDSHPDGRYGFERCAAELFQLMDGNVVSIDMTRFWRDGGRDALGKYQIGFVPNAIEVEFALEAKCKKPSAKNTSGVKETARLIARLRHRQFGVFVTTSAVHHQAYQEIVEDGHPVLILSGADIVAILAQKGITNTESVLKWLKQLC